MMEHGKELPPITLSSTTISYLVTLIPLLVSMTSRREIPSYEDEADKPAWWPEDIQWRNPKFYMQDSSTKDDCLKVLRKLVHSCYSYHGVEDLLIRLEESPMSDIEMEPLESTDIIQLTDDGEDGVEESSAESDGPVFVCCFCLDQFSSHEEVNTHQNICPKRFKENCKSKVTHPISDQVLSESPKESHFPQDLYIKSVFGPVNHLAPGTEPSSDFPSTGNVITTASQSTSNRSSSSAISKFDDTFLTQAVSTCSATPLQTSTVAASFQQSAPAVKKTSSYTPYPFIPTLKTRSQKKLDQMMEKHNLRRLMLQECREMKDVPETGAWWIKPSDPTCTVKLHHPVNYLSHDAFISVLGLVKKSDVEAMTNKGPKIDQEVDLDCEIVSVEGPLSAVPPPLEKLSSVSPRTARSLMSQLSRDTESTSRRRISFCFVEDEWADKEALEEGRDPLQNSLLTLDISSPLGMRVKKYIKGENHVNIIKDAECYCRTELDDDGYSKLRFRGSDYRVTFRKKRRATNYVHKYKFNKQDKIDFKKLLKTGLSTRSRRLQQCLPLCKVVLIRLTNSEIKTWTEEKKITIMEKIVYDDDLCITQIEIPESKVTQAMASENVLSPSPIHSPQQFYKSHHRPGPLSHYLGHANAAAVSRKSHSSSSPPHVPNIFRNRPSHNPSPPGHTSNAFQSPHPKSCISLTSRDRVCDHSSAKISNTPLMKVSTSEHQQSPGKPGAHLSRHVSLSPSPFMHRDRDVAGVSSNGVGKHGTGQYNNASRRKQVMTHVREDDSDRSGSGGNATSTSSGSFMPLGHRTNPFSRCVNDKSHLGRGVKTSSVSTFYSSSGNLLTTVPTHKLANFDYFSIRDGKLHQNASLCSPVANSTGSGHISTISPSLKYTHLISQHTTRHSAHHSISSSSQMTLLNSQQHHQNISMQSASSQVEPRSVIHHRPSPAQQPQFPGSHRKRTEASSVSRSHTLTLSNAKSNIEKRISTQPRDSLMDHLPNTVAIRKCNPAKITAPCSLKAISCTTEDEDILEVICIDDD